MKPLHKLMQPNFSRQDVSHIPMLCATFPNLLSSTNLQKFVFQVIKSRSRKWSKSENSVGLEMQLLNGPAATKKQQDTIAKNRNVIKQQRTK